MSKENWTLLRDKLRGYRPAVDADAAWQSALAQLDARQPARITLRQLLCWKTGEMIALLLIGMLLWTQVGPAPAPASPTAPRASTERNRVPLPNTDRQATDGRAAARSAQVGAAPLPTIDRQTTNRSSAQSAKVSPTREKRVLATPTDRTASTPDAESLPAGVDRSRAVAKETASSDQGAGEPFVIAADNDRRPGSVALPTSTRIGSGIEELSSSLRLEPLEVPSRPLLPEREPRAPAPTQKTAFEVDLLGGVSNPSTGRITPVAGIQLRLATGGRSEIVLGAAYQVIRGMDLHWEQVEYHKDFGYPTGNAVERWLDTYGAWEYSLGVRYRLSPRLSVQTDLQLTELQERGLRERIQGSDFFLGSSRRSLVDRDLGLRFGLDYRFTPRLAVYTQYLHGFGDISPNYLYAEQGAHRHGGIRVGLRLMLLRR